MKKSNLVLTFIGTLALFGTSLGAQASTTPTIRTSLAGHKFTQTTNHPELGDAWQDESGLIWGDVVQKHNMSSTDVNNYCDKTIAPDVGDDCQMTQSNAIAYCESINAALPSKSQFERLSALAGDSNTVMDINWKLIYPIQQIDVIPNLFGPDMIYMTSTVDAIDSIPQDNLVYVFQYGTDAAQQISQHDMLNEYPGIAHVVRCVEQ
jgi:hypothetical protein